MITQLIFLILKRKRELTHFIFCMNSIQPNLNGVSVFLTFTTLTASPDGSGYGSLQPWRQTDRETSLPSVFALSCPTQTHSPICTISAGPAACVPSVRDTELKGHSVLLLSPVKCHQATPALSSLSVSHVKSLWTIRYSLATEVHENIKHPTDRG